MLASVLVRFFLPIQWDRHLPRDSRDNAPQRPSINRKLTCVMAMSTIVLFSLESLIWSGPQIQAGRRAVTPHPSPLIQLNNMPPNAHPPTSAHVHSSSAPSSVTNVFCQIHTHDRHCAQPPPPQLYTSLSSPDSLLTVCRHSQGILLFSDN